MNSVKPDIVLADVIERLNDKREKFEKIQDKIFLNNDVNGILKENDEYVLIDPVAEYLTLPESSFFNNTLTMYEKYYNGSNNNDDVMIDGFRIFLKDAARRVGEKSPIKDYLETYYSVYSLNPRRAIESLRMEAKRHIENDLDVISKDALMYEFNE